MSKYVPLSNSEAGSPTRLPRRGVLALAMGAGASLVTACSGGDHGTEGGSRSGSAANGADRLRSETTSLAPTSYVKTYRVNPTGAAGAYKTIGEALAALVADKASTLEVGANSVYPQSNIWDWRCVEVAPGRYREKLAVIPPHTALVGKGAKPEDVYIYWDERDNTLDSSGRSLYVANLHLDQTNMDADVHSMHDSGSAGDIGLGEKQRRTVVLEKVRISTLESATLAKGTNDMVPTSSVTMVFHECVFDGPGQPQAISLVTNHGPGTEPSVYLFLGCKVISNHAQHLSADLRQVEYVSAAPVGVTDSGKSRDDVFLWMDGSWDVGREHGVQGLIVATFWADDGKGAVKNSRPATSFHLVNTGEVDGVKTFLGTKTKPPIATVPDGLSLPRAGVSEGEKRFFGRKPSTRESLVDSGLASGGTMNVQAGETFWVRVPLSGASLTLRGTEVSAGTGPGFSAGVFFDAAGAPSSEVTLSPGVAAAGKNRAAGSVVWVYPGQSPDVWVGVTFTGSGVVNAVKAADGAAWRSTGTAGAGPDPHAARQPVAAGQSVPAVAVVSQLPVGMRA